MLGFLKRAHVALAEATYLHALAARYGNDPELMREVLLKALAESPLASGETVADQPAEERERVAA